MIIEVTRGSYGFGHDWTLVVYGRRFWLGQDVKFCSRVLGMDPSDVVREIGTNKLNTISGRKRLARFIVDSLEITRSSVKQLESWSLCAQ
jgi:hypothetical protein